MTMELTGRAAHRAEITARAEAEMAAMGVDVAFIDRLVETFYGHIVQHPDLGPVFDRRLSGRWPAHMVKMKAFWASVAFKTGAYGGKPVQAHHGVDGMAEGLFLQWLQLFSDTLTEIGATEEAHRWFLTSAERIAKSLVLSLFYNPALDDPRLQKAP
ncbi:globin [Rhizobium sp. Root274]|uniref:group III truncated hemoglobin n=1 Tax=unclassified Rhizobium TaxID=2613769 RepID=UPI000713C6F2|nr:MULTISPECIES: truncated hemoglobin [unclassified Rhizobium]KQW32034.1 globin [Rhizobium sp. Root1240]KRD33571.1 globin [Rhizobium sp. Root274]